MEDFFYNLTHLDNMKSFWSVAGVLIFWALPWKIYAMWKAYKKQEWRWFVALFFLNTFAILDILYIYKYSKKETL
ncbi:MAG: DUF5652 family protein [Candidatus Magasanikbacteria bacterium]|nr:DUF5652 family protein [Candidatus Magasanikbacteria bacterium]